MRLIVASAPAIDRNKLIVRINESIKPEKINWYDYIEIKANKTGKKIVCKLHGDSIPEITPTDLKNALIYINEPLRGKLRVEKSSTIDFKIAKKSSVFAWYYFVRYHPDDTIVVATWLGIIAVLISVPSIVLSILALTL